MIFYTAGLLMQTRTLNSVIVVTALAGLTASAHAQTTATWAVPGAGDFFDAGNWDIGVVPMNAGASTFNVMLPYTGSFQTVELYQNSQVEINDLFIDSQVELSLNNSASLEVFGAAFTRGEVLVFGSGSSLVFTSLADDIDDTLFEARTFGSIELSATSYSTGLGGRHLYASESATVSAPSLESLSYTGSSSVGSVLVVADELGALIDLPALTSTSGRVQFQASDGGSITLGPIAGGDHTFSIDDASLLSASGLSSLHDDSLEIRGTGQFLSPPIPAIDGAWVSLRDGADYSLDASSISSTVNNTFRLFAGGFASVATNRAILDASSLTSASGEGMFEIEGQGDIFAPNITSLNATGTGIILRINGELDLSGVTTMTGPISIVIRTPSGLLTLGPATPAHPLQITVEHGTLIAPGLTDFDGYSIAISGATATFPATPTSLVDNAIGVSDGAVFAPTATTYLAGPICPATGGATGVSATQGGMLDLSTVTTMLIDSGTGLHTVKASWGGTVLLDNLSSAIDSSADPAGGFFFGATNGDAFLDLSSLGAIVGNAEFSVSGSNSLIDVSSLQTISGDAAFAADGPGSVLDITSLQAIPGTSSFYVADSGSIVLPDGTAASPITQLVNSAITMGSGGTFVAPTLERVTNTPISADRYATLAAPIHTFEALNPSGEIAIEVVDGPTSFAMPDLRTINIEPDTGPGADTARIETVYRATLDLSGVTTLIGPTADPDDVLMLQAEGWSSVLDLSGVESIAGQISVASFNESVVMLGGTLDVPVNGTFGVFSRGELRTTGDVLFQPTLPSYGAYIDNGIFEFAGPGTKRFEVARRDDGSPGDGSVSSLNFIRQLRVGTVGQATDLQLVDLYDNGERGPGGEAESLYIRNETGVSLVLEGGSRLYLGDVEAYVEEPGGWVRLRDLILPGDNCAAYGNGFVCTTPCPADLNNDGFLDSGDITAFVEGFLAGDPAVDFNNDGFLDSGDIAEFVGAFLAGC